MNSNQTARRSLLPGFLVLGLLWSVALGYLLVDWKNRSVGLHWYSNSDPSNFYFVLECLVFIPSIGLLVGGFLDWQIRDVDTELGLLKTGYVLLLFAVVVYVLFQPAFNVPREGKIPAVQPRIDGSGRSNSCRV